MLDELKERVTSLLSRVELAPDRPPEADFQPRRQPMLEQHPEPIGVFGGEYDAEVATLAPVSVAAQPMVAEAVDPSDPTTWRGTPRNAPCPCGSGKKYKHCHGRLA